MFARKLFCVSLYHIRNSVYHSSHNISKNFNVPKYSAVPLVCEPLKHRHLLKIWGPDTADYLQGMVTNDVKTLDVSASCAYAMLLNSNGRVLYDILLYKIDKEEYLLEYDATALPYMKKHLEMYRLRKNVNIQHINTMNAWVIFPSDADSITDEEMVHFVELITYLKNDDSVTAAFIDPRVPHLGCRIIVEDNVDVRTLVKDLPLSITHNVQYNVLRYKLGIGEGVRDHPPGNCLPLECNVDYLHGVSFQKGCYIGQELTARFHHTGTVRKRLMPVTIVSSQEIRDFPVDSSIINDKGMKMGKLRNSIGVHGLAVLNVEESLKSEVLMLKGHDIIVKATKPIWWPSNVDKKNAPEIIV